MRTVTATVTVRINDVWFIKYEVGPCGGQVLVEDGGGDQPAHDDGDKHGNGED